MQQCCSIVNSNLLKRLLNYAYRLYFDGIYKIQLNFCFYFQGHNASMLKRDAITQRIYVDFLGSVFYNNGIAQ